MADQIVTNETPSTGNQWYAAFRLVEEMIAAGWSVVEMSDGTTVGNTDNWTGNFGSLGADSWIILQANSGQQICFKRDGSTDQDGWIVWSRDGNFTTGGTATAPANVPSDATAPSASETVRGSVTSGTPGSFDSSVSFFGSNQSSFDRLNIGVRDASGGGDETFWLILKATGSSYTTGTSSVHGRLAFEKLEHESGLGITDPYPYAWYAPDDGSWGEALDDVNVVLHDDDGYNEFWRRWWPGKHAQGSITTVAQANLVDGETFVLDDGVNPSVTFEYDVAGDGVAGGNVQIDVSADTTPDDVRDTTIAAINGAGSLAITAGDGGPAKVRLHNDNIGTQGNVAITESVADAGFLVSGMSGGADEDYRFYGSGQLFMSDDNQSGASENAWSRTDGLLYRNDHPVVLHAIHLVKLLDMSFLDYDGGWTTNLFFTGIGSNLDTFGNGAYAKFGSFLVVWWDGDPTNPPVE